MESVSLPLTQCGDVRFENLPAFIKLVKVTLENSRFSQVEVTSREPAQSGEADREIQR